METEEIPEFISRSRKYLPDDNEKTREFEKLLESSRKSPERFWEEAAEGIEWYKKLDKTMEGNFPDFKFYANGLSNVEENLVERHIRGGNGNRAALIFENERGESKFYTYSMISREVAMISSAFRKAGLKKGSRVAIFLPNLPETLIAVLACYKLGILFNTIFSGFSVKALEERINNFEPEIIITADGTYRRSNLIELKRKVDQVAYEKPHKVIVVRNVGINVEMRKGDIFYDEFIRPGDGLPGSEMVEANDPGIVFYTSGTTGKPKGVVLSGIGFLVNNYVYAKYHLDLHPDDVLWCTADIGWLTMHIWGIIGALSNGITTLFYEGSLDYPSFDNFYRIIERYRVSKLFTAPTAIRMLMKNSDSVPEKYDHSSIRVIALVGEPLNPEAWHWIHRNFPDAYINNTWGQTETAGTPISGAAFATAMKPGSCGTEFLGIAAEIVDDQGNAVPNNVPGNLVLKAPFPMMVRDLWNDHERYIREYYSRVKGKYFTYDIAVRDDDGHFWILGRNDDVINVAGHRLSTMEMESAVMESNKIAECAVIGVPDPLKGIVPVVFITPKNEYRSENGIEGMISDSIDQGIGKFARPERVIVIDEMPKTPSGKILRRFLKEIFVYGNIKGDATGLENPSSIESIRTALNR